MSKKRKHHEFPDRETLIEYLKGGLSHDERHRIEKLMLEHEFLREVVEGLESEDPEDLEEDLAGLSLAVRQRSSLDQGTGFNLYKLAATVSLIILASVIIFVAIDWMTRNRQNNELSLNKQAQTEMDGSRENKIENLAENENMPGEDVADADIADEDMVDEDMEETSAPESREKSPERTTEKSSGEKMKKTDDIPAATRALESELKTHTLEPDEKMAVADDMQETEEVPDQETILEAGEEAGYERQTSARKSNLPEAVSTPVADEPLSRAAERYSGLSVPYMTAANLPHPVDGYESYMQYLTDSLRYPEPALNNGIEGQVIVSFTVGTDSIPRQVSVVNPLGYGCDQEAVRLIREGPAWIPAITGGKVVESEMKLPIRFSHPSNQDE